MAATVPQRAVHVLIYTNASRIRRGRLRVFAHDVEQAVHLRLRSRADAEGPGAKWWKLNTLSGGVAPAAFKGFADTAAPACGESWTTRPGNSSEPPAGPLPVLMEAVVSTHVAKTGPTISGDTAEVVLIATEPGYAPNPGHPGTGTVVGVVCEGEEGVH